jgi:hypothetical protein
VVIVAGLFSLWFFKGHEIKNTSPSPSTTVTNTQNPGSNQESSAISSRDNSNASLDKDMTSVDAQLQAVDNSSSQVDQSFKDTPVPQTE